MWILGLAVVVLLAGCERIVDVDFDPGPVRLVVEARLERIQGGTTSPQRIRLTTTQPFTSRTLPPAATGAAVSIIDDAGQVTTFPESATEPGLYVASLTVAAGARYTLRIDWDGDRYEATETVQVGPPIDRLTFVYEPKTLAADSGFRAAIDYTDPPGIRNFYLWEQLVNGKPQLVPDPGNRFRVIGNDDFYDGQTIRFYQPYDESIIEPGQNVLVRQIALSEAMYRYYFALFEQTSVGQGSPFGVPPANLRGNVANTTTPARYPLGYFWAGEISEIRGALALP